MSKCHLLLHSLLCDQAFEQKWGLSCLYFSNVDLYVLISNSFWWLSFQSQPKPPFHSEAWARFTELSVRWSIGVGLIRFRRHIVNKSLWLCLLCYTAQFRGEMSELDDAGTYYDLGPRKVTGKGTYHYMCTRNNNFSNRSQKGRIIVGNTDLITKKLGSNGGDIAFGE